MEVSHSTSFSYPNTNLKSHLSVFNYTDYRSFLKDAYTVQKQLRPRWSYGSWARQLGLKSSSTLIMIFNGQRNPGPILTKTLAEKLKLNPKETEYFCDLVALHKNRGDIERTVFLMEKLAKRRTGRTFEFLDHQAFSAVSHWHYYAIRELVQLPDFVEDVEKICKSLCFQVSPKQVSEAIATLIHLKLLARDGKRGLRISDTNIDTTSDTADEGIKRFHEQTLENARESLRLFQPSEREIVGTTFPVNRTQMAKAKKLIRKFQEDFADVLEDSSGDAIYHLEIAFFPVAIP